MGRAVAAAVRATPRALQAKAVTVVFTAQAVAAALLVELALVPKALLSLPILPAQPQPIVRSFFSQYR